MAIEYNNPARQELVTLIKNYNQVFNLFVRQATSVNVKQKTAAY
jgi:hypothetical protein